MFFEMHKTKIVVGSIIGVLALWALSVTTYIFTRDEKVVLVAVENGKAKLLSADSSDREETANFIKAFLDSLYNFNAETYSKNVGQAVEVMSSELWSKEKEKFLTFKKSLHENNISQSAIVERINLLDDGRFEAILNVLLNIRVSKESFTQKVILDIKKIKRSQTNPWGLEVVELHEARM